MSALTWNAVIASETDGSPAVRPSSEFAQVLGGAAPADRIERLSAMLRVIVPGLPGGEPSNLPVLAVLRSTGSETAPRFEASDVVLEVVAITTPRTRIDHANLILEPSVDGLSCRFELSGVPFGVQTRLEASGSVVWSAGPLGGDRVEVTYRLDDAPMDALREWMPERFDPSYGGALDVTGKAEGVVGETSNETAPATPLVGELEASLNWTLLGRTGPLEIALAYSMDDRVIRIRSGQYRWEGLTLDLQGWVDPLPKGKFDLRGRFHDVDTGQVALDWGVPAPWRPAAILSGEFTLNGVPGKAFLRYEATTPELRVQGVDGYSIRLDTAKLVGSLLAINTEVSASAQTRSMQLGKYVFPHFPVGLQWWKDRVTISTANSRLWGGSNTGTFLYQPSKDPAWSVSGRLDRAEAPDMIAVLVPELGLDVDGSASVTYSFGQDQERKETFTVHGSLMSGRLGNVDLFPRVLELLGQAAPKLATAEAASLVPAPRKGSGTRVDKFFFEMARDPATPETLELGGLYLEAGEFRLDADGTYQTTGELRLEGTVGIPVSAADKLMAAVPGIATLRNATGRLVVPVVIGGSTAKPVVELASGYAELVARAASGEAVAPPPVREIRHVGDDNLSTIPGDPRSLEGQ